MAVEVLPVQLRDVDAVVELLVAQMREHRIRSQRAPLKRIVQRVRRHAEFGFMLVARRAGQIAGVAYLATIHSVEHGGPVGWLEELYVVPAHRRAGIGTRLLKAVLSRARQQGLAAIDLEVDIKHRRAEGLYRRCGFRRLPRSRWARRLQGDGGRYRT